MFHLNQYPTDVDMDASGVATETTNSSLAGRPLKLLRKDNSAFPGTSAFELHQLPSPSSRPSIPGEATANDVEAQVQTTSRTRSTTACQRCRSRKTKCDTRRP